MIPENEDRAELTDTQHISVVFQQRCDQHHIEIESGVGSLTVCTPLHQLLVMDGYIPAEGVHCRSTFGWMELDCWSF